MKMVNVDLRYRDERGFVHCLREGTREVYGGKEGTRKVRVWTACCGDRVFTEKTPPALIDEPASCLECLGDVSE